MEQAKERPRRRADERGLGANQQCLAMLANTSTRHPLTTFGILMQAGSLADQT